jgi:glycosyltransferase involved in cell wall biosynthesis
MSTPRKIRILEMIDDASIGGGQVNILMLARHLDRNLFTLAVACEKRGYLVDELGRLGVPVVGISISNRLRWRTLREVMLCLRRGAFDILHTHGGTAGFWGRTSSIVARTPRVRIHTYHGLHYLRDAGARRFPFLAADRRLLSFTDAVVCVSQADFYEGLKARVVSNERGVVIRNGIETERFRSRGEREAVRAGLGAGERTMVFGTVGRLHVQKGQRYLLEAFAEVHRVHPDSVLWIVGEGGLRAELDEQTEHLGIRSWVHFLGARTDVERLLAGMDAFVLPSLWEGQPISLLEAMAAGTPVVGTSIDGVKELLRHGKNALLVHPKDAHGLARAMSRFFEEMDLGSRLASEARQLIEGEFTAKRMAERMGELYQRTLAAS